MHSSVCCGYFESHLKGLSQTIPKSLTAIKNGYCAFLHGRSDLIDTRTISISCTGAGVLESLFPIPPSFISDRKVAVTLRRASVPCATVRTVEHGDGTRRGVVGLVNTLAAG